MAVYSAFSGNSGRPNGRDEWAACGFYLVSLLLVVSVNLVPKFRGHLIFWGSLTFVTAAFAFGGYLIEQKTYILSDESDYSMGGPILLEVISLGLLTAAITSLSLIGNRWLNRGIPERPRHY